jgi:hypothetical protein
MSADALWGLTIGEVRVGGQSVAIRAGWLAVRRQTNAVVLPLLSRIEGGKQIVTIHAPMPPPAPDVDDDARRCLAAIEEILSPFVRRHLAQAFNPLHGVAVVGIPPGRPSP